MVKKKKIDKKLTKSYYNDMINKMIEHFNNVEDINYYKKLVGANETIEDLKKYYKLFKSKGARHHKYPATTSID
jgi:hypothetical protein